MIPCKRLTFEQRHTIECLLRREQSLGFIATAIGVHTSTVSREVRRDGMNRDSYDCRRARDHAKTLESSGKRLAPEIWPLVAGKLCAEQWSPEQISAIFRRDGIATVSHESIYRHIYADKRAGARFTGTCGIVANPTGREAWAVNGAAGSATRSALTPARRWWPNGPGWGTGSWTP